MKNIRLARIFISVVLCTVFLAIPAGNVNAVAQSSAGGNLLQFTSGGHLLGFSRDGVIIASGGHMLKADFIGSRAVAPQSDNEVLASSSAGMAPSLSRVTYQDAWDGVTVVYEAAPGSIVKSTYYVDAMQNGGQVERIRLGYNRPLSIDGEGNLVITYESGTMVESAPVAWQEIDGQRTPVTVDYTLYGQQEVGFSIGAFKPGIPVVIDPDLTWNTFLGGTDHDWGSAIAVDGSGNVYVAGTSNDTWGTPVDNYTAGGVDAFAAKLDSNGNLIWNTFLGGIGNDTGRGMAIDGSGNVYVCGESNTSWGTPVNYDTSHWGQFDAWAVKLNGTSGVRIWNTFMGGLGLIPDVDGYDSGRAIAVAGSNVYIGGYSDGTWGTPARNYTIGGGYDAFAAKLDSTSGVLTWNTFLGGSGNDYVYGIAADGSNVCVAGTSNVAWQEGSTDPVRSYIAGTDAFAAGLDLNGHLIWNTFLGGSGSDSASAIAVDGSGDFYVAGYSDADWQGITNTVREYTMFNDAFVAKLDHATGGLTWNTFLGGADSDDWGGGVGMAVVDDGKLYVVGSSNSTWGVPERAQYPGTLDAFAVKLNRTTGVLTWNTFLGGSGDDRGNAIAVDGVTGNVYVSGDSDAIWGTSVREQCDTENIDALVVKLNSSGGLAETIRTTTKAATGVTANTATLNMCYRVAGLSPATAAFQYRKVLDPPVDWTYTNAWIPISGSGTYGHTMVQPFYYLEPGTLYEFRAVINYAARQTMGSILQFTTSSTGPAHTIILNAVPSNILSDGASTSVLTATVTNDTGGPVDACTVVHFTTNIGNFGGNSTVDNYTDVTGTATATLTSAASTQIVIADVSASANSVSKMIAVFFTPPGAPDITESKTTTVTGSGTVSDTATGGNVTVDAADGSQHTVTTVQYGGMPYQGHTPNFQASGYYYDVHVDNTINLNSVIIQFSPAMPSDVIWYWGTGGFWRMASQQTNAGGVITVTVTATSYPSLTDLSGLFFGSGLPVAPQAPPPPPPPTPTPTPTPSNPSISTSWQTSHGSSMAVPTTPAQPVSLPNIQIQSAILSAKVVTPGTPVTVIADISNKSAVNGNKKVTLYVNGQAETTQGVTVNSGSSSKLTFNVSRSEPGDYTVYVDGVPAGGFRVESFRESDGILVLSAALVAMSFIIGMVLLWRRQRGYY